MKKYIIILMFFLLICSCTKQERAKNFGGKYVIELPKGKKLIEATWKGDDLWYLTRERRSNEPIENYEFKESSSYGVMEGVVIFKEK